MFCNHVSSFVVILDIITSFVIINMQSIARSDIDNIYWNDSVQYLLKTFAFSPIHHSNLITSLGTANFL